MTNSLILSDDYVFAAIQGEGPFMGHRAVFLRLAGCNLTCIGYKSEGAPFGCDTHAQWNTPHKMSFEELNTYFEINGYTKKLKDGARLIITGGEPLLQSEPLARWIIQFLHQADIDTINIDFETNGTVSYGKFHSILTSDKSIVDKKISINYIVCPKLSSNGDPKEKRYRPEILSQFNDYNLIHECKSIKGMTAFKFVVNSENDINEIFQNYINNGILLQKYCWLMPTAGSRDELIERAPKVIDWCIKYNFNYSNRTHIMAFDRKLRV